MDSDIPVNNNKLNAMTSLKLRSIKVNDSIYTVNDQLNGYKIVSIKVDSTNRTIIIRSRELYGSKNRIKILSFGRCQYKVKDIINSKING